MTKTAMSGRLLPTFRFLTLAAALVIVLAGCSPGPGLTSGPAGATPASPSPAPAAPASGPVDLGTPHAAWARKEVRFFAAPGATERPRGGYPAVTQWGNTAVFLVQEAVREDGEMWLKVLVPRRPNGTAYWVQGADFVLAPLEHRIEVDLSERRLSVLRGDEVVETFLTSIGTSRTPTPEGEFFVTTSLLGPPTISTVYGIGALGLSGYSEVLEQFGTGDGQLAIHGSAGGGVGTIGQAVSNGCLRLSNEDMQRVAAFAPPGTPVTVRA